MYDTCVTAQPVISDERAVPCHTHTFTQATRCTEKTGKSNSSNSDRPEDIRRDECRARSEASRMWALSFDISHCCDQRTRTRPCTHRKRTERSAAECEMKHQQKNDGGRGMREEGNCVTTTVSACSLRVVFVCWARVSMRIVCAFVCGDCRCFCRMAQVNG